jgi:hypothetical protein
MEEGIRKTLKYLKARNLKPWFTNNCREARNLIMDLVPQNVTVGIGDSSTIRQIGVIKNLKNRGTKVIDPFDLEKPISRSGGYLEFLIKPMIEATLCDVFLTGINAVTQDGRLLSIDGAGNRVAGMFWGHPQVILAIGKNKIVENLDEAFRRVRNLIAPEHLKRRGAQSPCTVTGRCHDCIGPHRICAVTTIIENKPPFSEMNVIVVDEDLGLGWDESWPSRRISKIAANHEKFMWTLPEKAEKVLNKKTFEQGLKSYLKFNPK